MNFQETQVRNMAINGNQAVLFVYRPKIVPTQVIRPYVYHFNDQAMTDLVDYADAKTMHGRAQLDPRTAYSAVTPEAMGTPLNTNTLSTYWTFVLIVDSVSSGMLVATPKHRMIASGYFTEEPFANIQATTPIPNQNSCLVFMHVTSLSVAGNITTNGSNVVNSVNMDCDGVGAHIQQHTPVQLFDLSPASVANSISSYDQTGLVDMADASIGNNVAKNKLIPTVYKSPYHHIHELGGTLANSMIYGVGESATVSAFHNNVDVVADFRDSFSSMIGGVANSVTLTGGNIDTSVPMTLGQLLKSFPNVMIQPVSLPSTSQWDVRPQDVIDQNVIMSSMVGSVVASIATGLELSAITFAYSSYQGQVNDRDAKWRVDLIDTIKPVGPEAIKVKYKMFQNDIERSLFPILLHSAGHFDMLVHFDMAGDTLVDLNFKDFGNTATGFVEIPNRFSAMVSPNLGSGDAFHSNSSELNSLLNYVSLNKFGASQGPMEEYAWVEHPRTDVQLINGHMSGPIAPPAVPQVTTPQNPQKQLNNINLTGKVDLF